MKVVAIVEDLFFVGKIMETAKRSGVQVKFVRTEQALWASAADKPSLVIVDLNLKALQPIPLIEKLKAHPDLGRTTVLGFVSHVQGELRRQAEQAGCDIVAARSSFSEKLPEILKNFSGAETE